MSKKQKKLNVVKSPIWTDEMTLCRSVSSHMSTIALNLTPDTSNTPSLLSR